MTADLHTLAGAYALNALSPQESEAFGEHLAQCTTCQQEVAELQATAAQLGVAANEPPPADLRARVLEAARHTRQIQPVTEARHGAQERRGRARLLAAAAAVVIAVGAGGLVLGRALDDGDPSRPQNAITAVINAPDARGSTVELRGGGTMTVIRSRRLGRAVVMNQDLPTLPADRTYQLWLVDRDGDARSAGVLSQRTRTARVDARLVSSVRTGDQVAITREPAGGSRQPTTEPLGISGT